MLKPIIISQESSLKFNGISQFVESQTTAQGGLNFAQPGSFQACTYEATVFVENNTPDFTEIFSSITGVGSNIHGVSIMVRSSGQIIIFFCGGNGPNTTNAQTLTFIPRNIIVNISITYNGSGNINGTKIYFNGVLQLVGIAGTLTTEISTNVNRFRIGARGNDLVNFFKGRIHNFAIINYEKTAAEVATFGAGTGVFLLAPIELNYLTNIKSLTLANINAPLPNSLALTNSQGHKMNLVGYPDILMDANFELGTDIKKGLTTTVLDKTTLLPSVRKPLQINKFHKRPHILNFSGQYLESLTTTQGGLDFAGWERTQPFTFMAVIDVPSVATITQIIYDNATTASEGCIIVMLNANGPVILNLLNRLTFPRQGLSIQTAGTILPGLNIIQITYDGSSLAAGVSVSINNINQISNVTSNNLGTSSILNFSNKFHLGRELVAARGRFTGRIRHLSFVNYVKSVSERTADFNLQAQSVGSGVWLLAPIEPIYPDNITTLITPNVIIQNAQGYKIVPIGYPNPLVVGTNLIEIPQ